VEREVNSDSFSAYLPFLRVTGFPNFYAYFGNFSMLCHKVTKIKVGISAVDSVDYKLPKKTRPVLAFEESLDITVFLVYQYSKCVAAWENPSHVAEPRFEL
jgi:hypothetical protein